MRIIFVMLLATVPSLSYGFPPCCIFDGETICPCEGALAPTHTAPAFKYQAGNSLLQSLEAQNANLLATGLQICETPTLIKPLSLQ